MSRNRAWRRAQALRLIRRRQFIARNFGWDADHIDRVSPRWEKVNPFTQCSCWMCQYNVPRPDVDWRREWET